MTGLGGHELAAQARTSRGRTRGRRAFVDTGEYLVQKAAGRSWYLIGVADVLDDLGLDLVDFAGVTFELKEASGFDFDFVDGDPNVRVTVPRHLLELA